MKSIRSKNTDIEKTLRKALWVKGYRYRKNCKDIPGTPDICFRKQKVAVFCDSEYFHGKNWKDLKGRLAKGDNGAFWIEKIGKNRERDKRVNQKLHEQGWCVLRFWGEDIKRNTDKCVQQIERVLIKQTGTP